MAYEFTTCFPQGKELNQYLQSLLSQAITHPPKSTTRRILLNKFLKAIIDSGELSNQGRWRNLPNFDDFYQEALDQTFLEICERIESYRPEKPVMAWVNFYFKNRFHDLVKKYRKKGITNIPKQNQKTTIMSLDHLEKDVPNEDAQSDTQNLRTFLQEDPEGKLKQESIQGYPHATLQKILWLRFIEDKKWKDISQELDINKNSKKIPISTLNSFTKQKMRKLQPYFKQYL
jgi:DNA-directed RNA polymerase specialized sigma24 family protein